MSLLSWITGYDSENAERAAAADAELRAINAERAKALGVEWQTAVEQDYREQAAFGVDAQEREIADAFNEGLAEGRGNITSTIKGAFNFVGKALASVVLGIPLWAWLLAAVGLWIYLGAPGLKKLKGKFA